MISYWLNFRRCDAQLKSVAGYLHVANHLQPQNLKIVSFIKSSVRKVELLCSFRVGISSRALRSVLLPALLKRHATALLN